MKKLFLLLLVPFLLQAQSRSEIQTQIETIATGVPNTALKIRNVLSVLADGTAQTGDVKEIDVSNAYLTANFDASGLGTNERLGWAICNGQNGTRNRGGRGSIQYNSTYPTLGAIGGSKDAVVVSHSHQQGSESLYNLYGGGTSVGGRTFPSGAINAFTSQNTSTAGESGTDKNMQPYIVSLFIQKL